MRDQRQLLMGFIWLKERSADAARPKNFPRADAHGVPPQLKILYETLLSDVIKARVFPFPSHSYDSRDIFFIVGNLMMCTG